MNALSVVLVFVAVFLGGVAASLVGDEVKGWVARIPYFVLWIASLRVPVSHRQNLHEDWIADLAEQLQDKSERPITRLVFGVKFGVSLVRGGRRVAEELGPMNREAGQSQTEVRTPPIFDERGRPNFWRQGDLVRALDASLK